MNFLDVVKAIYHGGPASLLLQLIVGIEHLVPASGQGAAKKAAVTALVNAQAPGIPPNTLESVIDGFVAGLNSLQAAEAKLTAVAPVVVKA